MLLRLLLFQLLFLSLPDLYIYRTWFRKVVRSPFYRLLYWAPTLFFTLGMLTLYAGSRWNIQNLYPAATGHFILFLFLVGLSKLLYATVSFTGSCLHRRLHVRRKPFRIAGLMLSLAFSATLLYGWLIGKEDFQVRTVHLRSDRLPASFHGYRIVQLSDFHAGGWQGHPKAVARLIERANSLKPDLLVFTGDLVNAHVRELPPLDRLLSGLHATDGVFSVLGNHDYGDYYHWPDSASKARNLAQLQACQQAMGWTLLNNRHQYLHRGNDSIALIGVENHGDPRFGQHGNLPAARRGISDHTYQILLSHNPRHWRQEVLGHTPVDLTLSGHTHAMQLSIGHFSPASWIYPEWGGLYSEQEQHLYVNIGCGHVMYPMRIGARPEITLIILESTCKP